jgi:nucleotide-binding universal stress UspA family protein
MKTILVGIDFTKSADNTVNYAIEIAKKSSSKILLFHPLTAPLVHTTSGLVFITGDDFIKDVGKKMEILKTRFSILYPKIEFDIEITYNGIRERVGKLSEQKKICLVVLGLETKTKIEKFIFKNTSVELIGKILCPIVTVPMKYKQHSIKKMLVAIDNKEEISASLFKRIHIMIDYLGVEAEFVHIKTSDELVINKGKSKQISIKDIKAKDFPTGIIFYAKQSNADIIMMISHHYTIFQSLFIESKSKQIILSSNLPVLSMHK